MSVGELEGYVPLRRCRLCLRTALLSALLFARLRPLADTTSHAPLRLLVLSVFWVAAAARHAQLTAFGMALLLSHMFVSTDHRGMVDPFYGAVWS